MNFIASIPANYDISLTFIVLLVAALTVYMGLRCIRRINVLTVIVFLIQLCMLTTGILTIFNRVLAVPLYEMTMILFGVILPVLFFLFDYMGMKKRIRVANSDVPLIEKLEKQSNTNWHYEEYIDQADEWKAEIKAGAIVNTLKFSDKHLKSNVTHQLSAVHKLIDSQSYKQALDIYMILAGLLNENPLIVYNTAWLYHKNELFEDAIKYYKKALYLVGDEPEAKDQKKIGATEEMEAIRPTIHFNYGLSLYAMKKYELAINQFNLAKKKTGGLRESEMNIARCYIAVGVLDEAQKHIKMAIKIKEDNKLRYLLAQLCFEKNEKMECKYQLETIVASDVEFTEAWTLLGKLYRKGGDWKNAQVAYKKLTQLTPQDADVYYRLGVAQREEEKTAEAFSNFKFATELMPEHSKAFYSMASIFDAEGKTDKTIECLEKSLEGNEKLEMAYNLLAEIYISNDKIKEAIYIYEESIREYPESYLVHFNLGVSLMMMKRHEEAVRVFKRAQILTHDDSSLYYNWASAEIGLKNYSEAARLYKEGLKFEPDDDEILFGLARVSALSGDVESTLNFLTHAFEINPRLRLRAKASHDFAAYRTTPEFMEITQLPMKEERKNA